MTVFHHFGRYFSKSMKSVELCSDLFVIVKISSKNQYELIICEVNILPNVWRAVKVGHFWACLSSSNVMSIRNFLFGKRLPYFNHEITSVNFSVFIGFESSWFHIKTKKYKYRPPSTIFPFFALYANFRHWLSAGIFKSFFSRFFF